jgi:diguanylate cyclase (GGDEF)-like protein
MDAPSPTTILILARQPETAQHWAQVLAGPETTVWQAMPEAAHPRPDLIVTDRAEIGIREAGDPAVVRIGDDGPGDARLPADCAPRELRLACQLLVQIVRLRRRERQAAEIQRKLSVQALTDPLTGLPNRRAWDATLQERAAAPANSRGQLCLAILDLDRFKQINDIHGHAIGDEVLRATAQAVYDNLRQDDFVARLGGDEFGLLLWVPDEEVAAAVIERVRASLPARFARTVLPQLTASAGYRLAECNGTASPLPSPESLYTAADASLREAKRRGRNRTLGPGVRDSS